eukprot:6179127-Pleurochrysis_carterae.AAC.1
MAAFPSGKWIYSVNSSRCATTSSAIVIYIQCFTNSEHSSCGSRSPSPPESGGVIAFASRRRTFASR